MMNSIVDINHRFNLQIMCFSAEASFTSGAILTIVGVAAVRQCKDPRQYLFASIPLLLAVQQFSEGYLWLILSGRGSSSWQQITSYTFLIFAQVVWPIWIPFAILVLETNRKRKKILVGILGIGIFVSFYLGYRLITEPMKAEVVGYHISYFIGTSNFLITLSGILYFICTVLPAFVTSINKMYLFGISIAISYFFSSIFFEHYIISVWCFFAAITSILVFFILFDLRKRYPEDVVSGIEFWKRIRKQLIKTAV